jgi:putative endonuclease
LQEYSSIFQKFISAVLLRSIILKSLVYYSFFPTIEEAITEEKRIKGGSREKKVKLVESINPLWEDLWKKEITKW